MVLFNLDALKALFDDDTIKRMFFIPKNVQLALFSHVVLTSDGGVLAPREGSALLNPQNDTARPAPKDGASLFERFSDKLSHFDLDEADCLGVGELEPFFPPALLYIKIKSGIGEAQALFSQEPIRANYELLQAVGVKYLAGEWQKAQYLARFSVDLSSHISAGRLSDFSKTGYCNAFFLRHGSIGPTLEKGLVDAARSKIEAARVLSLESIKKLGQQACKDSMPMLCQPPPPAKPFPFGDLVPLGFLLKALRSASAEPSIRKTFNKLEKLVLNKRQGELWSFHAEDITTSTDSALVLLGIQDPEAIQALETFSDGHEGYYPQLWSQEAQPGKMQVGDWNRHWCQSDFATTCLIRALRREAGMSTRTTVEYLEKSFESRGGLFFANPYLVDWALARAIRDDETALDLRKKLLKEVLASMNEDCSFGVFDRPLSTAFAVLCLAALEHRSRSMLLAQYRLSEYVRSGDAWPNAIPFYSTFKLPDFPIVKNDRQEQAGQSDEQIVQVDDQYHAISYYLDQHRMIETAVIALALSENCSEIENDLDKEIKIEKTCHPRYRCHSHSEYIATYVLPLLCERAYARSHL